MSNVKLVKPTEELIWQIADDMRDEDAAEVWAAGHYTPFESLYKAWQISDYTAVATHEGDALVMFGLVHTSLVTGTGVIWMLGNNKARGFRREFMTVTPLVLEEMLTICPKLCNMVHTKNSTSVKWLRRLGFTIEPPVPHGPDGELFHRFHLERE